MDDFPLIVQTRGFDVLYQITTASHEDNVVMVNGTTDAFLQVPKQTVRLRLLNASADRTYYFGLSNNSNFYMIASDGGILSQPVSMNRLRLSTGERAEILINFNTYSIGQQIYLMSYASELPRGIIGADTVGVSPILIGEGYYNNLLNGADFNILRFDVIAPTTNPVTTIPSSFSPVIPFDTNSVAAYRNLHFFPDTSLFGNQAFVDGPFFINDKSFNIDSVNIITYLNNKEIWTMTNSTMVAHPFHIHDIQFFVLDINGNPPPPQYRGYKDVMLVQPNDTVRFITKFETFANNSVPYMFHCHLLHHEDEGMMGAFLVMDTTTTIWEKEFAKKKIKVFPNPVHSSFFVETENENRIKCIRVMNLLGVCVLKKEKLKSQRKIELDVSGFSSGIYFLEIETEKERITEKIVVFKN